MFVIILIGGSFGWFFGWNGRMDERILRSGLEGAQQVLCFGISGVASVLCTFIISSLIGIKRTSKQSASQEGLGALEQNSYIIALRNSFRKGNGGG